MDDFREYVSRFLFENDNAEEYSSVETFQIHREMIRDLYCSRIENFEQYISRFIFEDDDEEFTYAQTFRRPRVIRERVNYLEIYDDVDFKKRFRLSKENVCNLLSVIGQKLLNRTERNNAIPPIIQLLLMLRFAATGSFLMTVADFCGISVSSAQMIVHKVTAAIAALHTKFIKFPNKSNDILKSKAKNFNLSGFPRVIGAIDCIHIRIKSYGGEDGEIYRNRKGFFSINVQAIVDSSLKILDLVAHWPGSTHDATIFNNSFIKMRLENGEFGNGVLLGDSGYPSLPFLLTPLQNPQTAAETLYNEAQIRTRSMVERAFGILGKQFPVLTLGSRFRTPENTLPLITACVVLFNITRSNEEDVKDINVDAYNNIERELHQNLTENEREYFIHNYFQRLL